MQVHLLSPDLSFSAPPRRSIRRCLSRLASDLRCIATSIELSLVEAHEVTKSQPHCKKKARRRHCIKMPREEEDEGMMTSMAPPTRKLSHMQSRYMDESEVDALTDEYVQADSSYGKTWSRIIVERYLSNVSACIATVVSKRIIRFSAAHANLFFYDSAI